MITFFLIVGALLLMAAIDSFSRPTSPLRRLSQVGFLTFFSLFAAGAIFWLTMGIAPVAAQHSSWLHQQLHEWGGGELVVEVDAFDSASFVQREIILKSRQPVIISFMNHDHGVRHNISIYRNASATEPMYKGTRIRGPEEGVTEPTQIDYTFTAPQPGTYYFRCDIHPDMHGIVTVVEDNPGGVFEGVARRIAITAHNPEAGRQFIGADAIPGAQILLEYLFSALNIGLAIFLVALRPRDWACRLLALGFIGTAAVFNVQGHTASVIVPDLIDDLHDNFHVTGVAYLYALVLFPDGRFAPGWSKLRWFGWPLRVLGLVFLAALGFIAVSSFHGGNPIGFIAFFGVVIPVAGVTGQAIRVRHARAATEREQSRVLMWGLILAFAATLLFALFGLILNLLSSGISAESLAEFETVALRVFPPLFAAIPVMLVVILVRYRLWDIDRIINRALIYGALTVSLGLAYVVAVILLQQLFQPLTRGSDLAIAGSTLAVAALFRPLLSRVRTFVDRRFNRRKYNAEQTIEAFSTRLRESVHLNNLRAELSSVVDSTMQPTFVSIWLRPNIESAYPGPHTNGQRDQPIPRNSPPATPSPAFPFMGEQII